MTTSRERLTCGHTIAHHEHGWVSSDGQTVFDTLKCLDVAEGRKPQKYGRDE